MKKYFIAFVSALIAYLSLKGAHSGSLFLIPQPKLVEMGTGTFNFNAGAYSTVYIYTDNTSKFYSEQLKEAVARKFKVLLHNHTSETIVRAIFQKTISLVKTDSIGFAGILMGKNAGQAFVPGAEGYILSIDTGHIAIRATGDAGIFYGVQTLIQLINANSSGNSIPCLTIYDKPDMQMRGWQDDISRGPIPTMDFLKEEIRRMASFKLNTFTLYTEHVFKLKKHPGIAPVDGITDEEIRELVKYARNYHVDIIGNFQSFGHFEHTLKVPGYEKMGENHYTLSPAIEESYKFLADAYSEVVPAYENKYFHINCDEVALGSGPSKAMIDTLGVDGVYAYHINRIDSLLKPYNKRIMMWGDIAVHNPGIINRLPKDMIIVSWGYAAMETRDADILPFVKSGFQFIVAPGVSCWGRIYPDISRATVNIYNYLRDGYKYNALGFINTTWDDDGQNLFNNNWYSLAWGADCGWNAPVSEPAKESEASCKQRLASFNHSYNRVCFNTGKDITSLLSAVSNLNYGPVKNCLTLNSLWNPLLPDPAIIPANWEHDNATLVKTIDSLLAEVNNTRSFLSTNQPEIDLLHLALRQSRVVASKNLLGIKLKNYVAVGTSKKIRYFTKDFKDLADSISAIKPAYIKLWRLENRNWWLDTVLAYYNTFGQKLDALKGVCLIKPSAKLVNGKREISLRSAFNNLPVYYTTNGTIPTTASTRYSGPIYTDKNISITARVIDQGRMYDVQQDTFVFHLAIGELHQLNTTWSNTNPAYAAGGELALLDGRRGNPGNFEDGAWQGYLGKDINIELDLGRENIVSKITIGFGQLMPYGILYPKQIEAYTSTDGINYVQVKAIENTISPNNKERGTHDFILQLPGVKCRYLKLVAVNAGPLPEWHFAKGQPSWLFADEVIVE